MCQGMEYLFKKSFSYNQEGAHAQLKAKHERLLKKMLLNTYVVKKNNCRVKCPLPPKNK